MFNSIFKFIAEHGDEIGDVVGKTSQDCKAFSCYEDKSNSWEDYCSYHQRCLSKLREKENFSNSDIRRLETFETWFNGNCGYVIVERDNSLFIWLVIYEPAVRSMSENLSVHKYKSLENNLGNALRMAKLLKEKLQNDDFHATPLLDICKFSDKYINFDDMILNSRIVSNQVGSASDNGSIIRYSYSYSVPSDLDRHFKPLDIVWVKCLDKTWGVRYYHAGVVLGDNYVCHFSRQQGGTRVATWDKFLEDTMGEIIRYHPTIPFKHSRKIVKQIAWVVEERFREDRYCLANRNCEHLANMLVYGINYSKQVNERQLGSSFCTSCFICCDSNGSPTGIGGNNDKGDTIKLTNEMRETNDRLGYITNWRSNQMEERIEVPPKQNCLIM